MSQNAAPFAINTYSYTMSHTARACIDQFADQGYVEFELMMYPGHLWPADTDAAERRALSQHIARRGLRVVTLNMPNIDINIAGAAAEMRAYSMSLLRGVVELAGDLGVPGVIIGPGKSNPLFPAPKERLLGYFYAGLDELVPLAKRVGTAIYIENMPFAFLPDVEGLNTALDRYGSDEIGIVYDIANGHFVKEDLGQAIRQVKRRLKLVHISDTNQKVYRHDPVGLGDVPFAGVPAVLREIGHHERPALEIISTNPDHEIPASAEALLGLGWGDRAA